MSSVWRKSSKRARARSTTHATHSDQANRTALWVFNLGVTLPCPLAPCVTTPTLQHHCLPNVTTTVTKSRGNELLRTPLRRSSRNFDQPKFAFWAFSEVHLQHYAQPRSKPYARRGLKSRACGYYPHFLIIPIRRGPGPAATRR